MNNAMKSMAIDDWYKDAILSNQKDIKSNEKAIDASIKSIDLNSAAINNNMNAIEQNQSEIESNTSDIEQNYSLIDDNKTNLAKQAKEYSASIREISNKPQLRGNNQGNNNSNAWA